MDNALYNRRDVKVLVKKGKIIVMSNQQQVQVYRVRLRETWHELVELLLDIAYFQHFLFLKLGLIGYMGRWVYNCSSVISIYSKDKLYMMHMHVYHTTTICKSSVCLV